MRLNSVYYRKHARSPQNELKVPFKERYPLVLANRINEGTKVSMEGKCLFEMSLLFRCWNENKFNNQACNQFELKLKQCYKTLVKTIADENQLRKKDVPTPDTKTYTAKQLTYLLRQYPTV